MKSWAAALQRRTLKFKLALGFGLMLLIAIAVSLTAYVGQHRLAGNLRQLHQQELRVAATVKEARASFALMEQAARTLLLAPDAASRERAAQQLAAQEALLQQGVNEVRAQLTQAQSRQLLGQFELHFAQHQSNLRQLVREAQQGEEAAARAFISSTDFEKSAAAANQHLTELARLQDASVRELAAQTEQMAEDAERLTAALLGGGLLLGLLLGGLITRSIIAPAHALRAAVEELAAGKLALAVPCLTHPNEMGDLARAIAVLHKEARQMESQRWIKTHVAAIASTLQQAKSFSELGKGFLAALAPLVRAGQGVFYVHEPAQKRLRLLAAYAFRERKSLAQHFALGEGLVGQCAQERIPLTLAAPPADYIQIGSSLGAAAPHSIAALPILHGERLMGVIELATLTGFNADEQMLMEGLLPVLAMSMEVLEHNVQTQKLLEKTQAQAGKMEADAVDAATTPRGFS